MLVTKTLRRDVTRIKMPKSPQKKPHQTQQSNPPPVRGTENVVEVETVTADQTEAEETETEVTVDEVVIEVIVIETVIGTETVIEIIETIEIVTDITDDAAGHATENSKNHAGQEVETEIARKIPVKVLLGIIKKYQAVLLGIRKYQVLRGIRK